MGAKYTAQSGMGLLGKNENLSSPSGPMLKEWVSQHRLLQ